MGPTNNIQWTTILQGAPVAGDGGGDVDLNEGSCDEDLRRLRV